MLAGAFLYSCWWLAQADRNAAGFVGAAELFIEHGSARDDVVDCVAGVWSAPPSNAPTGANDVSNGAYTGNGDLGIVVGAAPVAPTTLAFYMDLMQWRCPTSTGKAKCGYGSGGHAGVGWLGVQVDHAAGERIGFTMQQLVRRAHVSSQSEFSSGVVLNSRAVAYASENLAVVELWYNKTSASAPAMLSLDISDEAYSTDSAEGGIMACRTNKAGQHSSNGTDTINSPRPDNRPDAGGSVSPPPWQWVESWLGRGYQDHRGLPAHHDVFPLTSRVEHVVMGTAFGGEYISRKNVSSNSDGKLGDRSWSTVTIAEGQVLRLSTQLWTERDFNFTRDPMAAVAQSMRSVNDPAHIARLEAKHEASWHEYWNRSAISMPHSRRTELFWYGAVYMWQTANLYNESAHMPPAGLWKNHYTGNDYGWPAYTTDINTQAPYFATYSSNHQDVAGAMYQLNLDFIPAGRMLSSYAFNCPGVLQPVEIGARGALFIMEDQGIRSNAILAGMIFVMHWQHTLDVDWLRNIGYPYLKEVAAFWSCYLVKDEHGTYLDLNDCCYEICGANDYASDGGHIFTNFINQNNPSNSLGMISALFHTMIEASSALGVDSDLRAGWQDILSNLHPFPTAVVTLPNGRSATILADWQGAPPPPKNDRQMLSSIQPIYPGGQFWRSMPNRTAFSLAADTMEYLDYYSVQADTFCIMYTISGRVGANQTLVFPQMVATNLHWGLDGNSFMENLMTLPQVGPAALVYVNELFVQSHESFVRFYPSHFTDTGVMGGPPRGPAVLAPISSPPPSSSVCNLTGQWSMPDGHGTLLQEGTSITGQCCVTPANPHDKEFICKGNFTGLFRPPPPLPPPPPPIPAVPGQPQCGTLAPPKPTPPLGPSNIELKFYRGSNATAVASLAGVVSNDCNSIHWSTNSDQTYTRGWKSTRDIEIPESEGDPYHGPPEHTLRPWLGSRFTTLRAHGAFLLSGSLSEIGEVGDIKVFAEKSGNFTFLTPWPAQHGSPEVRTDGGDGVDVEAFFPPPSEVYLEAGERLFRFACVANGSYILSPPKQ